METPDIPSERVEHALKELSVFVGMASVNLADNLTKMALEELLILAKKAGVQDSVITDAFQPQPVPDLEKVLQTT